MWGKMRHWSFIFKCGQGKKYLLLILYQKVKSIYRMFWSTCKSLIICGFYLVKSLKIKEMIHFTPHYPIIDLGFLNTKHMFKIVIQHDFSHKSASKAEFLVLYNAQKMSMFPDCYFPKVSIRPDHGVKKMSMCPDRGVQKTSMCPDRSYGKCGHFG